MKPRIEVNTLGTHQDTGVVHTHTQTHSMHSRVLLEFSTISLGFCCGRLQAEVGFGFYLRQEGYFLTVRLFVGRIPQKLLTGWRMGLSPE